MEDIRDLYIIGEPIETDIGQLHFLNVNEYGRFVKFIPFLNLEKFEVESHVFKRSKDIGKLVKCMSYLEVINGLDEELGLRKIFSEMFTFCFKEDVFHKIQSDEEFEYYRMMIRKINCINYVKKNPNPEIERFNELRRVYDAKRNGDITFESIFTSVQAGCGVNPNTITLYNMYALFGRISQIKNYETMTLYNTVAGDMKIEGWYKHIDLLAEKQLDKLDNFSRDAEKIMK